MPKYAVLLADVNLPEPSLLAKVWADFRKIPNADAALHARNAWGILADDLAEAEATALAGLLRSAQLEAVQIPADRLATLPEPTLLKAWKGVPPEVEGVPLSTKEALEKIPWGELSVIGATVFDQTVSEQKRVEKGPSQGQQILSIGILMATGIPVKIGGRKEVVVKKQSHSEVLCFLDLCAGSRLRWRIDAQHFDYSFLKERKTYSVFGNFKLLLKDLAGWAPAAVHNRGARILLEGKEVRQMGYSSLQDLERELRWLITLAALRKS